ncbi:hypothetical protein [Enterobacter sp. HK-058-C-ECC]|uniref:hypothetical protein n=1 Tax=Enterobacter sp. HK-058-C-ECC TaxID=3397227 RepID=UPI0039E0FB93
MTDEQMDELMIVAVNMQRDAETDCNRPSAMFAYAVQVAVLELRKVRNDASALAAENELMKKSEPAPFSKLMMEALDVYQAGADEVPELAMLSAYKKLRDGLKTPATDAFLAEIRAQAKADGVQEYADSFRHSASKIRECHGDTIRVRALLHEANNADEFAAQLRKGLQS